jgi:hypothetical protein
MKIIFNNDSIQALSSCQAGKVEEGDDLRTGLETAKERETPNAGRSGSGFPKRSKKTRQAT